MSRLYPDTFYVNGNPIPASYFQNVDSAQYAAIDGDAGGAWSPSTQIVVAGAGMWCTGPWYLSPPSAQHSVIFQHNVGANIITNLTHGDSDYIVLQNGHTSASRQISTAASLGKDASGCPTFDGAQGVFAGATAVMLPDLLYQCMANTPDTGYPYRPGGRCVIPLDVHNGATLSSVVFYFSIANTGPRTQLPANQPLFRVHKVDIWGNLTPLGSSGSLIGNGFLPLGAASLSAYTASTSITYACVAGTVIDTSQYFYVAEIVDETGTNALNDNVFESARAVLVGIPDMRPQ